MRRKARKADQNYESGNRREEKGNEERIRKEGWPKRSALKICDAVGKEKDFSKKAVKVFKIQLKSVSCPRRLHGGQKWRWIFELISKQDVQKNQPNSCEKGWFLCISTNLVGATGFEPAASTSKTQKHRFFASFCVLFRVFSSEPRAFTCCKSHNFHVVRSRRWSKVWSGQIPIPYLFSRIHSSRSSYFISPAATARPTLATSSTEGWI